MSQSNDDGVVKYAIAEALRAISKGDAELLELKLVVSRSPPIEIKDVSLIVAGDEKFEDVTLTKLTSNLKAKLEIRIKQKRTGREVKPIVMPKPGKVGYSHVSGDDIDVQDFGHLPNEAEAGKDKRIKKSNVDQVIDWTMKVINILISIINAFITWRSKAPG